MASCTRNSQKGDSRLHVLSAFSAVGCWFLICLYGHKKMFPAKMLHKKQFWRFRTEQVSQEARVLSLLVIQKFQVSQKELPPVRNWWQHLSWSHYVVLRPPSTPVYTKYGLTWSKRGRGNIATVFCKILVLTNTDVWKSGFNRTYKDSAETVGLSGLNNPRLNSKYFPEQANHWHYLTLLKHQ